MGINSSQLEIVLQMIYIFHCLDKDNFPLLISLSVEKCLHIK